MYPNRLLASSFGMIIWNLQQTSFWMIIWNLQQTSKLLSSAMFLKYMYQNYNLQKLKAVCFIMLPLLKFYNLLSSNGYYKILTCPSAEKIDDIPFFPQCITKSCSTSKQPKHIYYFPWVPNRYLHGLKWIIDYKPWIFSPTWSLILNI